MISLHSSSDWQSPIRVAGGQSKAFRGCGQSETKNMHVFTTAEIYNWSKPLPKSNASPLLLDPNKSESHLARLMSCTLTLKASRRSIPQHCTPQHCATTLCTAQALLQYATEEHTVPAWLNLPKDPFTKLQSGIAWCALLKPYVYTLCMQQHRYILTFLNRCQHFCLLLNYHSFLLTTFQFI